MPLDMIIWSVHKPHGCGDDPQSGVHINGCSDVGGSWGSPGSKFQTDYLWYSLKLNPLSSCDYGHSFHSLYPVGQRSFPPFRFNRVCPIRHPSHITPRQVLCLSSRVLLQRPQSTKKGRNASTVVQLPRLRVISLLPPPLLGTFLPQYSDGLTATHVTLSFVLWPVLATSGGEFSRP